MSNYVSLFNASASFSDAELQAALPDLQAQLNNDFLPAWGLWAYLDVNGGGMPITIVDYPGANDPQGALGYHYVDGNFQPYAVIFAGLCRDHGYSVTGVISHELLEMIADTEINNFNLLDHGDGTGFIVIQEVCDPCEMSLYYEAPNGTVVSDFALPGWWVPGYPYKVDFLGQVPGPLQLLHGGYISYRAVTLGPWQQASADKLQQAARAQRDSLAAGGDPRLDVRGQLALGQVRTPSSGTKSAASSGGAPNGSSARVGQDGPSEGVHRNLQIPRSADDIQVVKRQDVPTQKAETPSAQQGNVRGPRTQEPANS